jgi:hypothetical protein
MASEAVTIGCAGRDDPQTAVAELSIYGSEDAWTLHLKMAATMPPPGAVRLVS